MHADSETTHPVKFLPELTCKSKVSLNCLEKVKIIRSVDVREREKNHRVLERMETLCWTKTFPRGRVVWKLEAPGGFCRNEH